MRTGIVVAMLAVIALAIFNPDIADFQRFVTTQTESVIRDEIGDGMLSEALARFGSGLAGQHVDEVTERRNFIVFSTYSVDLDGDRDTEEEWRFVGIAGQFFQTHAPE